MSIPSSAASVIEAPSGPRAWHTKSAPGKAGAIQYARLWTQIGFFVRFIVAPVFDIFRIDLTQGHAIILGLDWRLGLDEFFAGRITATEAGINILLRLFLPLLAAAAVFLAIAWRWGRLYCGWLCPHFSVVETINRLMRHASGKQSLWDRKALPG